jgi:hypothetical protein
MIIGISQVEHPTPLFKNEKKNFGVFQRKNNEIKTFEMKCYIITAA